MDINAEVETFFDALLNYFRELWILYIHLMKSKYNSVCRTHVQIVTYRSINLIKDNNLHQQDGEFYISHDLQPFVLLFNFLLRNMSLTPSMLRQKSIFKLLV